MVASARLLAGATEPGPPPGRDPLDVVDTARTRIVTTSDADEEVRAAVRAVIDAVRHEDVARSGSPSPVRHARALRPPRPRAAGGGRHSRQRCGRRPAHRPPGGPVPARAVGPARNLVPMREDVFAWLAGARLYDGTHPAPHGGVGTPVARCRGGGGAPPLDELLATHAAGCDAEAEAAEADPDAPEWRAESLRRGRACPCATRLRPPGDRRAPARHRHAPAVGASGPPGPSARARRRSRQPAADVALAGRSRGAEGRRACGTRRGPARMPRWRRAVDPARRLRTHVGRGAGSRPRAGRPHGRGRADRVGGHGSGARPAVVLGLSEGSFPAAVREDSLLPDDERAATGSELARRAGRRRAPTPPTARHLAGAGSHLLCIPRGDLRRSAARVPSRWVTDVAGALAGERPSGAQLLSALHAWVEHVASFDAGIRVAVAPADEQEYRLRALLAAGGAGLLGDGVLERARDVVEARRSHHFTRFDGNVAGVRIPSPAEHTASATRLEWLGPLPIRLLRARRAARPGSGEPRGPPADLALDRQLGPRRPETFILEVLARPPTEQPGPDEPWSDADRRRMIDIAEDKCRSFEARGLTGRPIFWSATGGALSPSRAGGRARQRRAAPQWHTRPPPPSSPSASPADRAPSNSFSPNGRAIRFRGKADRLDVAEDGLPRGGLQDGEDRRLQGYHTRQPGLWRHPVAARRVWHRGASALRPCGHARLRRVLVHIGARRLAARIGYEVTPEVVDRVSTSVGTIVEGIESASSWLHPTSQ